MSLTPEQIIAIIGGLVALVTALGTTAAVIMSAIAKLKIELKQSAAEVKNELQVTTQVATQQRSEVQRAVEEVKGTVAVIHDQTNGLAHAIVESNKILAEQKGRSEAVADTVAALAPKPAGAL